MNKFVSIFVLAAAISAATSQLFRSRALNQNQRYPVPWSNYPRSEPLTGSEPIRSTLRPLTDHDEPYSGTPNFVERPGGHQFVIVWDRVTSQRFWIPRKQFYAAFKGILNQVDPAADRVYPIVRNDNWGASATSRPINVPHQQRPFSAPTSDEVSVRTRVHNRPPKDDEEYETAASTNLEYSRSLSGRGLNGYETFQPKIQPVYHPAGVIPMWFDHAPDDNFRAAHLRRPLPIRRYHSAGYQGYQRRVSENTPIPPCNTQGSQYLHQCRDTLFQYMSKNVMKNERLDTTTRRPLYQNLYKTESQTVEMASSKGGDLQSTTEAVQPQAASNTSTTETIQAMEEQRTTEEVQAETTVVPVVESEVETVSSYLVQSDSVNDVNLEATTSADFA